MSYCCCYASRLIRFEVSSYLNAPIPAAVMIVRMMMLMIIRFVVTNNRFLVVSYVRKNIITAILDVLNVHYYQIS